MTELIDPDILKEILDSSDTVSDAEEKLKYNYSNIKIYQVPKNYTVTSDLVWNRIRIFYDEDTMKPVSIVQG